MACWSDTDEIYMDCGLITMMEAGQHAVVEKHGTCSYPVIQDEYSYFSTALDLYFKYNITKMLTDAGYTPNNYERYPLGGIVSAIEDAFGATPLLVCKHGAVEELPT
ncbi:hypothetical protein ACLOJK_011708 [Asimina triloba]